MRYLADVDSSEVAGLARAMTLKYGFLGLPQGGAKAGIVARPGENKDERAHRISEFGIALAPWLRAGTYFPGTDMGITLDDLRILLDAAGIRLKPWRLGCSESGTYTALTVFEGIASACREKGRTIDSCTFALEGFGAVGSALAGMLFNAGGRILAVSTRYGVAYNQDGLDIPHLLEKIVNGEKDLFQGLASSGPLSPGELKELPVDIFSPCARHDSITAGNAGRIRAWAIVPGANNPVTPEAEKILLSRGILCLPDFVTNCGGVLGGTMAFAGVSKQKILEFIGENFAPVYRDLLDGPAGSGVSIREYAEKTALERHQGIRNNCARPSIPGKILDTGVRVYRAGLVPKFIMGKASLPYFRKLGIFSQLENQSR